MALHFDFGEDLKKTVNTTSLKCLTTHLYKIKFCDIKDNTDAASQVCW